VAAWVFLRDQRGQLEQLGQRRPAELAQRRFGDEQVAALDGSLVDRSRVSLRRQRPPQRWGRTDSLNLSRAQLPISSEPATKKPPHEHDAVVERGDDERDTYEKRKGHGHDPTSLDRIAGCHPPGEVLGAIPTFPLVAGSAQLEVVG
jgi:hypothetical protein